MDDGGPTASMILFAVLILTDMFFYGFGSAINSLNIKDIERKAREENDKKSRRLAAIIEEPAKYVNMVQLIVTLINIVMGSFYLGIWIRGMRRLLEIYVKPDSPEAVAIGAGITGAVTLVFAVAVLTYILLTFGVLLPKKLAARYPEKWAYICINPVYYVMKALSPFTGLVTVSVNGILRLFGMKVDDGLSDVTEEEIISMVNEGHEQGVLLATEAEMITNIFEFGDKEAHDIMTHRNQIVAVEGNMPLKEAVEFMLDNNNSRFPVYEENLDHIIGILHLRDAMRMHAFGEGEEGKDLPVKEIKVLKDAVACALYGIKAANGVIEITSLRGNPDGRTTTSYSFNMGITTRGRRGVEMMDTDEKLELERRLQNRSTPGYRYSEDYYRKYFANDPNLNQMIAEGQGILDSLRTIHTDWFDELIHLNTYQRHNLSVRGGSEKTSYYVSANYVQQGGRVPGNDTHRFTATMSLDQQLGRVGYLSLSANAGYSETDTPNGSSYSPTDLIYQLNPYETKTGQLVSFSNETSDYTYNDLLSQYNSKSTDKRGGVSGSLNLEPLKGLSIDAVAGIDMLLNEGMTLVPSTSISERNSGVDEAERGKLSKEKNVTTNVSSNIRITYNKIFAEKHDFTIGGNMDYYMTDADNVSITGYGVGTQMSPSAINQSISGNRKPVVGSYKEKTAQLGVGLVMGYSFDNTYDLFATYKADASSILPESKRWNAAWAIGLGWTISQYPFLKDNNVISRLNLKASYGRMANLAGVSASSTIGTFSYSTDYYGNARLLQLLALYNTDLKAEQTASMDISLSVELFKRLTLDANIYRRETSDALLDVPVPLSNGFSTMKRNIGVLRNEGYELSASLKVLDTSDWRLSLRGSLAYNRNKVVDLYYADRLYASEEAIIPDYEIGKSYDMIYGLKSLGINPITGLPVFQGADGREIPATENPSKENIVALGHATPPYSGIFNLSFSYRDFDLDMDFYYVSGGVKSYSYSYVRSSDDANKNAIKGQLQNMWFEKGDEGKTYHSPFYSSSAIASLDYPNTETVGKSDYLKLSMVSLRYRVPHTFLEKNCNFIKYANVAFQASNLFMITPYKESDPETGSLAGTMQPVLTINLSLTF